MEAASLLNQVLGRFVSAGGPTPQTPTNQAPLSFQLATLHLATLLTRIWRSMVTTELLPPAAVVVSSVAMGELGPDAMVVGNLTRPTQGVKGKVVTPILGPRVLRLVPPVRMEA